MREQLRTPRDSQGRRYVETRFRVRYHETDAMGIVHHAAYITWFEEGRSAFTRAISYPLSRLEAEGVFVALAQVSARYHRPARYDEEVVVAATLSAVRSRGFTFEYEVRNECGDLLVSGDSSQLTVDRDGGVVLLPASLRAALEEGP